MKPSWKIPIGVFILVLCVAMAPKIAWADENQGRYSLGVGLGVMIPSEDELESSLAAGFSVGYGVLPALDLHFGYNYAQIRDVEAPPDGKLDNVEINSIELGLQYKIMPQNQIVPYVGVGVGYYVTSVDGDNESLRDNAKDRLEDEESYEDVRSEDIVISITKDNAFGAYLAAGMEFFFVDKVSLQLEGRYTWFDPSLTVRVEYLDYLNENISGLKGDNAQVMARFKIYF